MLSPEIRQRIQQIYIRSRFLATEVFSGEFASAFRGRGMEFEEVREYFPGDDIRTIDWNVTARMGQPFVKVFREEREQTIMLLVDASASHFFGSHARIKLDVVTEIAALLAYTAIKSNDKVGLIVFTDHVEHYIPPKKGRAHVWHVISEILSYSPSGKQTNISAGLTFLNHMRLQKSVCFILSDFQTADYMTAMRVARQRHDLIALCVSDPLELSMGQGALIHFQDLESDAERLIDFSDPRIRAQYQRNQTDRLKLVQDEFRKHDIDYALIYTNEDYVQALLKLFQRREGRL